MTRFHVLPILLVCLAAAACGADASNPEGRAAGTHLGEGKSGAAVTGGICPKGATVPGIDVSDYQGTVDWHAVKASGQTFAIARINDGTYMDPQFDANWSGMKSVGLIRGAYQFFEPGEDATTQANVVVSKVGQLGSGDLPVMLDMEVTGGQSGATITSKIHTWMSVVQAGTGKKPIIYTGAYFWDGSVGSADFSSYALVIAWYGTNCPGVPNAWAGPGWTFHQYTDAESVSGISGNVDGDVFNGTLAELQAFAQSDKPPEGWLDAADCTEITGWTYDADTASTAINVDLYFDGPAGSGSPGMRELANVHRNDLCQAIGSCDHGYVVPTPRGLMDTKAHKVYPYGIDSSGKGDNPLLQGAPKSFTCAPPPPPFAPAVKRHVTDPASFASWKFSALTDVAHYSDTQVNGFAAAADMPSAPVLVQADDGTPEVWIIDGNERRHVTDPASMAAWRFDGSAVKKTPAAQVYAHAKGLDWPHDPFLVMGSGPAVYTLDVTAATPPPSEGGDGGTGTVLPPGELPDGGAASPPGAAPPNAAPSGDSGGGCNAGGRLRTDTASVWAGLLLALSVVGRRRRRRG